MPKDTLWDAICRQAETDGAVSLEAALETAAVNEEIAKVELAQMARDGLISWDGGDSIVVTDRGKLGCTDRHIPFESPSGRAETR